MSSKWDFVKNMGKKDQPAQPTPPANQKKAPTGNAGRDIELGKPAPTPGVFDKVKNTLQTGLLTKKAKEMSQAASDKLQHSINFSKNLPYIIILCCGGGFFMVLAMAFIPLVLLVPHKFSLLFAMGGGCFLAAIGLVRGPEKFFYSLLEGEKLKWSIAYGASIFGTLACALVLKSRPLALICAIAQVFSLGWIIMTNVPGAKYILQAIKMFLQRVISMCMG